MSRAKIVGIHGGRAMSGNTEVGPLPAPLISLRDEMKLKLKSLLQNLFDNADDALFAMADKAGSNGDQTVYFDAMRELRLQKKIVATELIRSVIKSYNELGHFRSKEKFGEADLDGLSDWDNVSLVQNDDLELNVAIEGMVSRLRNGAESHLSDIKARIESLMPGLNLNPDQIPLSPEMLCESFSEGCNVLDVGIQVRLIVFKLFEKYVLSEIPKLYIASNQSLVQQGVLPNLKAKKVSLKRSTIPVDTNRRPQDSAEAPLNGVPNVTTRHENGLTGLGETVSAETGGFLADESLENVPVLNADQCLAGGQFESIRELMHPQTAENKVPVPQSVTNYTQSELVSALSGFQQKQLARPADYASNGVIDYKMLLNASLPKQVDQAKKANYSELDSDVINLVSMLFEFILDDRQLQPMMKALISRLQIPILKVALLDRNFFDRGGHPARKLLNEIASAAIGWNEKPEGKPDRLKDKIETTIQSILEGFDNDQLMFTDLLAEFTKFMDLELRRGQLVEQRTKDSERGKAANDVAKQEVQTVLKSSLKDKKVPSCVVELLNEAWSRLMVLRYLKEGKDSEAWQSSCDLVTDVIWTVLPENIVKESNASGEAGGLLLRKIPTVMSQLRLGLKEISFDNFKADALFKALESEHIKAIQYLQKSERERAGTKDLSPVVSVDAISSAPSAPSQTVIETVKDDTAKLDTEKTASVSTAPVTLENTLTEVSDLNADDIVKQQDEYISDFMRETQEMENDFKHFQALSKSQRREESGSHVAPESNILNQPLIESSDAVEGGSEAGGEQAASYAGADEIAPFEEQVLRFTTGCWFEFKSEDKPERCKLAAIIKATGKYIFVNRSGVKVAEKTKSGLALELKRGSVQVLNDGLLFDRALESVIDSLRGRGDET